MEKNIKIYSTPSCVYCHMAKQFFEDNNIDFEYIDVSTNQEAAEEMVEKSGQMGVPVIEINGEIVIGFNEPKIQSLINN